MLCTLYCNIYKYRGIMELFEKTLDSELKFDGKILKLKLDKVQLPDGSK